METKFEYMVLIKASNNDALVQRLNALGSAGWRFVCFLDGGEALMMRKTDLSVL